MGAKSGSQRVVRRYLRELRRAASRLPRAERRELFAQIEEHIVAALPPGAGEAETLEVLERLGEPEQIVAEQYGPRPASRGIGAQQIAAVILLLVGGFLAGVGWIVGVVLLWTSQAWTFRDKVLGTLILPGGLFGSLIFVSTTFLTTGSSGCFGGILRQGGRVVSHVSHCSPGPSTLHVVLASALFALVIAAPIATAVLLARHARPLAS